MTESRKAKKEAPTGRAEALRADAARAMESLSTSVDGAGRLTCAFFEEAVNRLDSAVCGTKVNSLPHAGDHRHTGCKCSGGSDTHFMADLIVLIDTSGSMNEEAGQVSAAVAAALRGAKEHCNVDLRIAFMGVEGVWPGTIFTTDYLAYLKSILNPDPVFETDAGPGGLPGEEGANAIVDLSKYYDWRRDACRAIFYISDEELDSDTPLGDTANEDLQTAKAIAAAKANKVTVFAHHITNLNRGPNVIKNYTDLCDQTGGKAFFSDTASREAYEDILVQAICGACGLPRCEAVEAPDLEPCISVSWGDSPCDCFETDDTEIVCITVCNCYSNISFSNFRIMGIVMLATGPGGPGPVPALPDGTPSVQIVPPGPVCFGDIPPCRDDQAGCVSRQFVIRTRGAKSGDYLVALAGICYDVCFHYNNRDAFTLTLCAD
ncbi:MAG TPA: hypothetical protein VMS43_01815 [Allosphingosinicella sp.]|nr:hypothetical protein [Allosphingosinicella sp.]